MIMQTISRFLLACVLVIGTIQGSAERNMPIGWGAVTAVGLVGSAVAAYKLAKSKNTLKKVRAALKKNLRSMRLQMDEEDAEHSISVSALVLTIAGLVSLLGGYKVGAAVLSQQQVASAPSASQSAAAPELRPGDRGYREMRPGFNSKGERIWQSDSAAPLSEPSLPPVPGKKASVPRPACSHLSFAPRDVDRSAWGKKLANDRDEQLKQECAAFNALFEPDGSRK
ncbi:MAG: hypothetical protein WCJ17_01750 [bacterium]